MYNYKVACIYRRCHASRLHRRKAEAEYGGDTYTERQPRHKHIDIIYQEQCGYSRYNALEYDTRYAESARRSRFFFHYITTSAVRDISSV